MNSASGMTNTTTEYLAQKERPTANPSSRQDFVVPVCNLVRTVPSHRPEGQLNRVMIELGGCIVKVMQAVDDENGRQRAHGVERGSYHLP
jgi:hypothetical protein